jgi:hypothetical protein
MNLSIIPKKVLAARIHWRRAAIWLAAALCLTASGCGPARAKPADIDLARETLTKVLEHWKQGGIIEELREAKPEIVVQERLWTEGNKLLDFTLAEEGRKEDANWYCEVELTIEPPDGGKPANKKVTYVVGTDPVLTVFHAIL